MDAPTIPESHLDLLDAQTAILATIGPDGRPQLSAVWFLRQGDEPKVSLNTSRQKVKNLRANPAVTLFVHDQHAPTRYLELRGDAVLEDDPDYELASLVGEKYGADLRVFDGDNAHRVTLSIRPSRINAVDMLAGS
jgi:PPOX class probable F420-dependent enzyme